LAWRIFPNNKKIYDKIYLQVQAPLEVVTTFQKASNNYFKRNTMEMDEAAIIAQCQQGNLERFAELYDAYNKKIYNFIYFRTHHRPTAEDITSTVFFKALQHIASFNSRKAGFSTWLYQIARNTVIDHYRSLKTTNNIEDAWDLASSTNIERDVDTIRSLEKVQKFLKDVPAQQRDIVIMRVWDGLSHKEIAEVLGISESTSKMAFSRIITKMNKEVLVSLLGFITLKSF